MNSGRNKPVMTIQRAKALLDAYGAAPEQWPAEERDDARVFVAGNPEARQYAEEARRLDRILDGATIVAPSASLIERVFASFDKVAARPSVRRLIRRIAHAVWPGAPLWQPSAALAVSLAAGMLLGLVSPLETAYRIQRSGSDVSVAMDAPADADDGM